MQSSARQTTRRRVARKILWRRASRPRRFKTLPRCSKIRSWQLRADVAHAHRPRRHNLDHARRPFGARRRQAAARRDLAETRRTSAASAGRMGSWEYGWKITPHRQRRSMIEAVVASTIGTTIEWYDFFLYGTAAALVFPALFFPGESPFIGQILSFGTFTVGFVARPIGGVIFGYMGDRIGRKATLVTTLLLMGSSTLAVGFLPTYAEMGAAAPILLTVLRFLQGLGVGGEWGGAVLFAVEHGHRGQRGFNASWPQIGVPLGLLASTGVMGLCQNSLSEVEFHSWGWRIPFYLSGALIAVGLLIRLRILETPLFAALKKEKQTADSPVRETLRRHWRVILLIAGTRLAENGSFYLFTVWVLSYGKTVLMVDGGIMLRAVLIAAAFELFTIPLYGACPTGFRAAARTCWVAVSSSCSPTLVSPCCIPAIPCGSSSPSW